MLEIGSGTGQHAAALQLAFPALDWQASDPSAEHRASTAAWFQHVRLPARAALDIDAATDWADLDAVQNLGPLQAVVSMNVLHIAPFAVTQSIIAQARTALSDDGMLLFYGPFAINGDMISDGNRAFDAQLRANDPNAGIRDTDDIAQIATQHHMRLDEIRPMPANNQLLILRA